MGILDVGITGLRVAQLGLQTTSHNIANASTPGYNRQETKQTTNAPNLTGYGYFGQGAQITTVRRVYNDYLTTQILGAETNVASLDSYLVQAKQIDNLLADPSAGLAPAMSNFFQAVQQMAADPSSVPARQSMLSSAQALVARFGGLDQRMGEIRNGVNAQIVSEVEAINAYANQLAELNEKIVQAVAISQGNPPNDLFDQRDQLVRDLNQKIRVTTVAQGDGSLNLFIGSGQPLVVGVQRYQLSAGTVSSEDPERVTVNLVTPNGAQIEIPESFLAGGALGGLLEFRSETLDVAQNGLGRVATALALTFNAQHNLGVDLQGQFGLDIFSSPQPTVLGNLANVGTAVLSANIIQSDYLIDLGTNTITRLSGDLVNPGDSVIPITGYPMRFDGLVVDNPLGLGAGRFILRPGEAGSERVVPYSDNPAAGTLTSTSSNLQNLPAVASDYKLTVIPNGLQMERLADGKIWSVNSGSIAAAFTLLQDQLANEPQGFVLNVDNPGNLVAGDTFLIEPTRQAVRNLQVVISDPLKIAAAAPFRTESSLTNKGTGKIDVGRMTSLDPALTWPLPTVTVRYDAASSSLILTGGINTTVTPFVPGQPNQIDLNGLRFTVSGVPTDGDTFIVEANTNGVSDNRNAIALGALQTAQTLNGGATTYTGSYGQIVSYVGNRTREVEVTGKAQQSLADAAETSRQELSGVNLDEEAANLVRYQQAYQASAKVMEIAGSLFNELLDLGR